MSSSSTFAVAHVFYVDHQGHPAPLSLTYHATASRRLSSSVDRYPRATITEVDSAYCPQCLAYLDTPTASRLAYCPKPTCQRCPMCQSVAIITARENLCFYQCGRCDWDSRAGQLQVQLMTDDDEPTDRLALARAAEDLHSELKHKKEELCKPLHTYFNKVRDYWARDTDEQIDLASRNISSDGWSMEALESKLATKSAERESIQTLDGFQVQRLSLDDEVPELETLQSVPELSFQLQSLNSCHIPEHRKDLLPLPTPLRVRFSRRCRAELAAGRPGILLKPKLDPLDGDSSLRSGDGRWMKKDCSAVHSMPQVRVAQTKELDGGHVLLLKISNPTIGDVRLRFTASSYQGEPDFDNAEHKTSTRLANIIVDPLTQEHVSADLHTEQLKDLQPTPTIVLHSDEESIMDFGNRARQLPDFVRNWNPKPVSDTSLIFIGQSSSTAWLELSLKETGNTESNSNMALPLALQIEVGDGSWETSLIPVDPLGDDTTNTVSFDLVIVMVR